jgi:O-antigen ligase
MEGPIYTRRMRALHRPDALPQIPDPTRVALAAGVVVLGTIAGAAVAGGVPQKPVLGLTVVAAALILLSLPPHIVFLGWFLLAPLLQESASANPLGHPLALAFYFGASVVFVVWTLTQSNVRRLRFLDALPALYFGYVLVALLLSGQASSVTLKGVYLTVGIGIALYYFFAFGPIGSLSWTDVVGAVLVVTVLEGAMAIIDSLTHWNLWHDTGWRLGEVRAVATLSNPAVLGTFLGMGVVLGVAVLVWNGPRRLRTLAIAAVAVGLPGLYFTLTRAPIIGTTVAILLLLASRQSTRILAAVVCILAAVILTLSWSHITSSTVYRERVTNAGNVEVRFALERWSWKLIKQKPVLGWGYNSFDKAKAEVGLTAEDRARFGTTSTSHNSYLTVLVEYGAVGFVLLALPWLVIPARALGLAVRSTSSRWFLAGSLGAIFVYVLSNNAGDFKYFSFVPAVSWMLLGLIRRTQLTEV